MRKTKSSTARSLSLSLFLLLSLFNAPSAWAVGETCASNPITTAIAGSCALTTGTKTINAGGSVAVAGDNALTNNATGVSLVNSGAVTAGGRYSLYNFATASMDTLTNSGRISAGNLALWNMGSITTLTNLGTGTIRSDFVDGIYNESAATIGTLSNSGTISSLDKALMNLGSITTFTNSGTISADRYYGVFNDGNVGTLTNTGTISSIQNGLDNNTYGTIGALTNSGTISASAGGALHNSGTITTLTNSGTGTIKTDAGNGGLFNSGTIGTVADSGTDTGKLTNYGSISAGGQYGLYNENTGSIRWLINSGTISAATTDGLYNSGTITTLTNSGTISAGTDRGVTNASGGTIGTLTNSGTITGSIVNNGTITTLNNAQGGSGSLGLRATLPVNYNVIVSSTSNYGKLTGSSLVGSTNFGIAPTSTLATNTYAAVLSGFTKTELTNQVGGTVTGIFSGLNWTLSPEGGSPTTWDLIVTAPEPSPPTPTPPSPSPSPPPTPPLPPTPAPIPTPTDISTGGSFTLASIGATTNPVFAGGTLALTSGVNTSQPFTVGSAGGTVSITTGGTATMTGALTGPGAMTISGGGTLVLGGTNTYSGGTTVSSGTLVVAGPSPTGTGGILVSAPATLMGTGTIAGNVMVYGAFKPGNSPGYLSTGSNVTMSSGATYQQDIAGRAQASSSTPAGSTGYYSFLNVGGQYIINPGATLTPRLQNLFSPSESGYGSAPYVPVVGDKFRILTADGGITGKFTTLTQPAGLDPATQFISFYNYNNSNSLDLAVIPASFNTAVASSSGNKNAQSVASALDRMVVANQATTSTAAQEALLYTASGQSLASLPSFTQGMAGEIYGATLAVVPQTSQRIQQAVISRLGDTMSAPVMAGAMAAMTNTAISASNPGGQPTASMSSNPNVNPYASGSGGMSISSGAAWGEVAYQYGNRASDSNSGGWSSNLVQAVVGVDLYSDGATKAGGGVALSNTNVSANQGSGTVQQGSLFLYGKLPVQQFVVDAMASYGFNSTNNSRNDATGITNGLQAKNVQGNDALVGLGLNLPIDLAESRVTPYIRATWQQVNQNGFNEGSAASALTVNSFNGNGVRGVLGVAAGSKALDPIKEQTTYRVNVGLGVDSTNVLNPQLNASLAGMTTTINTPSAGTAFVQAGMYGTIKFADNAFAYGGVTAEARSGQVLAGGNIGVRIQF